MQSLQFSASAENDLLEAWLYVAEDNPVVADGMLDQIKIEAESLRSQPLMGRARGERVSGMIDDLVTPQPFPKIQPIQVSEHSTLIPLLTAP